LQQAPALYTSSNSQPRKKEKKREKKKKRKSREKRREKDLLHQLSG